jgi:hypothetical protein
MPKATKPPTTRHLNVAAPLSAIAALPSLADLGRLSTALHAAKHVHDCAMVEAKKSTPAFHAAKAAFVRAQETACALDELAISLPVQTLQDAAAWAVLCFSELDVLRDCDAAEKSGLSRNLGIIFRGIAGMAIVLAEATGQTVADLSDEATARLVHRHAGVEVAQ